MSFGVYLRELIDKRGYSYRQLGKLAEIDHTYISKIVNGKMGPPSPEILKKISKPLGIAYETLMEKAGYIVLSQGGESATLPNLAANKIARVPVLGNIKSGEPLYAKEHIEGYKYVAEEETKYGEYFYLLVTEDTMVGSRIQPGDLVYIRKQNDVENGDIALIYKGKTTRLQRVFKADGKVILQPDNPKYEPEIYTEEDIQIVGKVLHVKFEL